MNFILVILLSCAAFLGASTCTARELASDQVEHGHALHAGSLATWFRHKFSQAELEGLRPGEVEVESHSCGCYDQPKKHFPYLVVVVRTPKGDLVLRPELQEGAASFTPIAVRSGMRYCEVETEGACYGSFEDPCDFTDARFGPHLAAYFPTCKSDESQAVVLQQQEVSH